MGGNLHRRIAAAEIQIGVGQAERRAVKHRPDLDGDALAAWKAGERASKIEPQITIVIRVLSAPWPPCNAAEANKCLTLRLADSAIELAAKIGTVPAYPGQHDVLTALAGM